VSSTDDRPIRDISDTARWAAVYRANESDRPDALFRDPFARRLAGARGVQIAESLAPRSRHTWMWVTRTWLFDRFITEKIAQGVDTVVNLGAGLDARPYRMALPSTLQWIEVDLPDLLTYKEDGLKDARPVCSLTRVPLDLSNVSARRDLFEQIGRTARRAVIVTEGLTVYLTHDEVRSLARDVAQPSSFEGWVIDLVSPGLLRFMQKQFGGRLSDAGAPLKFGPAEGPEFFASEGWRPVDVRNMLKTAAPLKRLSPFMRFLALLPASAGTQGLRPWTAVCLLERVRTPCGTTLPD
jgi:methyltransferase (TIGR00027 family)